MYSLHFARFVKQRTQIALPNPSRSSKSLRVNYFNSSTYSKTHKLKVRCLLVQAVSILTLFYGSTPLLLPQQFLKELTAWHKPQNGAAAARNLLIRRLFDESGREITDISEIENDKSVSKLVNDSIGVPF